MVIEGGADEYVVDPDGWTIRTRDGSRAAHAEHTVAVTADGPRILTPWHEEEGFKEPSDAGATTAQV